MRRNKALVFIYGPPAVGKMTVGMELARQTGLKLFHNHQTIDLLIPYFRFGSPAYQRCINTFRLTIFKEVAKSSLPGLIFTLVRVFENGRGQDDVWVKRASVPFRRMGAGVFHVELSAGQKVRLGRNRTPLRLREKPTKRNIKRSDRNLLSIDREFAGRLNTGPEFKPPANYIKIDNTHLSASATARLIKRKFSL